MKKVDYPSEADWHNYYIAVLIIVIVVIIVGSLIFTPAFNYRLRPTIGVICLIRSNPIAFLAGHIKNGDSAQNRHA